MTVTFVCIPTALAAHAQDTITLWANRGYKVALFLDTLHTPVKDWTIRMAGPYPGVWKAWNALAKASIAIGADACFLIGDDMSPPSQSREEITNQYLERFPDGFGVLQGTGDKQGGLIDGKWASQRICGSPLVGRGWVNRAYGGNGPVDGRYGAFYADESLLHVARRLGVLWQREDVTIYHRHWSFPGGLPKQEYHDRNNRLYWDRDRVLFNESLRLGFPEGKALPRGD